MGREKEPPKKKGWLHKFLHRWDTSTSVQTGTYSSGSKVQREATIYLGKYADRKVSPHALPGKAVMEQWERGIR